MWRGRASGQRCAGAGPSSSRHPPALPGQGRLGAAAAPAARVLSSGRDGPRGRAASAPAGKLLEENMFVMLHAERLSPKLAKRNIHICSGSQLVSFWCASKSQQPLEHVSPREGKVAAVLQEPRWPFAPPCCVTHKKSRVSKYHNKQDKRRRFQPFSFPWERWARCEGNIILGAAVRGRRGRSVPEMWAIPGVSLQGGAETEGNPLRAASPVLSTSQHKPRNSVCLPSFGAWSEAQGRSWRGLRRQTRKWQLTRGLWAGPAEPHSPRGAIPAGTGSSGLRSPQGEGAGAPETYLPWRT